MNTQTNREPTGSAVNSLSNSNLDSHNNSSQSPVNPRLPQSVYDIIDAIDSLCAAYERLWMAMDERVQVGKELGLLNVALSEAIQEASHA